MVRDDEAPLQSTFSVEPPFVRVTTTAAPDLAGTQRVLEVLDGLLREHRLRAVLFDTRGVDPPTPDARECWWAWIEAATHHDRVAVIVMSEMTQIRGNMTALSRRSPVRSFTDIAVAEAWLRE